MKTISRILVCQIILLFSLQSKANPILIEYPQVFVSELSFDAAGSWSLELEMFCTQMFQLPGNIDSVVIQTNQGRARILSVPGGNHILFVITNNDLSGSLQINPYQDTVCILTYLNESIYGFLNGEPPLQHILVFGYPDCEIPVLLAGQSISAWEITYGYPICFYKDNSPTPGLPNDTVGATAQLQGKFYDSQNRLITSALYSYAFSLSNNVTSYYYDLYQTSFFVSLAELGFDLTGSYTTKVLSGNRSVAVIDHLFQGGCPWGYPDIQALSCESFQSNQEPGQVLEQNIRLTDTSFKVGLNEMPSISPEELTVVCSPNPFASYVVFYLSSLKIIKDTDIMIYNSAGQLLKTISADCDATSWSGRVSKDELGSAGIYHYIVLAKGQKIKTGQIICQ